MIQSRGLVKLSAVTLELTLAQEAPTLLPASLMECSWLHCQTPHVECRNRTAKSSGLNSELCPCS